jgi:hypothetical protein
MAGCLINPSVNSSLICRGVWLFDKPLSKFFPDLFCSVHETERLCQRSPLLIQDGSCILSQICHKEQLHSLVSCGKLSKMSNCRSVSGTP